MTLIPWPIRALTHPFVLILMGYSRWLLYLSQYYLGIHPLAYSAVSTIPTKVSYVLELSSPFTRPSQVDSRKIPVYNHL